MSLEALPVVKVFADDADAYVPRTIINRKREPISFEPLVAVDDGPYDREAVWQGPETAVRVLHIPTAGLAPGRHRLALKIPNDVDADLGVVEVLVRT
jgi:hypothetical protein